MIKKEYNEYGDKLVSADTAFLAEEKGFNVYSPECLTVMHDDNSLVSDDWTGLIAEGWTFKCFRPTVTTLQKWLRDKHKIHIFIGHRPNTKKWDSHFYSLELSGKEYVKERTFKKFNEDELFDTYEEALEAGVVDSLKSLNRKE